MIALIFELGSLLFRTSLEMQLPNNSDRRSCLFVLIFAQKISPKQLPYFIATYGTYLSANLSKKVKSK